MTFVQLIDCRTSRFDEMNRLMDTWVEQTKGKRTATHSVIGKDRSDGDALRGDRGVPVVRGGDAELRLPETDRIFQEMVALCDEMPTFTDLDVVRDEQLYAGTARRFLATIAAKGELPPLDDLLVEDYHDHVPSEEPDAIGMDAFRRTVEGGAGDSTSSSPSRIRSPRVTGCARGGPGTRPTRATSSGFRQRKGGQDDGDDHSPVLHRREDTEGWWEYATGSG